MVCIAHTPNLYATHMTTQIVEKTSIDAFKLLMQNAIIIKTNCSENH